MNKSDKPQAGERLMADHARKNFCVRGPPRLGARAGRKEAWLGIAALLWLTVEMFGQPQFENLTSGTNGWVQVQGRGLTNHVVALEASSNLVQWTRIALLDSRERDPGTGELLATNLSFQFWDTAAPDQKQRFYRCAAAEIQAAHDWKSQAHFPNDAFASLPTSDGTGAGLRWLKFAILLNEPHAVYYQDSDKYLLHHDFAAARLEPFTGMSRAEFDQVSLFANGQRVLLGSLLFAPDEHLNEYAIQFAGRDPYPRATVRRFFELVRSTVVTPAPGAVPLYFPAYEQSQVAASDAAFLAEHGIRVSSINRWIRGDQVYAGGWALGRVTCISAAQIAAAYLDGRLQPGDILLTDGVPAEVPFVSGIISLAPATPNSHAAILAQAYGVPFVYVSDPVEQARLRQFAGKEAVLQGIVKDGFGQVHLIEAGANLDNALRAELLELKTPAQPRITPKAALGAFSAAADSLVPDDIRYFGGKAANFGLLRRVLPSNSPPAIAFSFDLWEAFMDQTLASGQPLRTEISNRLSRHTYPPGMSAVAADLRVVRDWIIRSAQFDPDQRRAIVDALAIFDPNQKIRFRSSSNAEDTQTFTAAGLYDSYSGCMSDDLDADSAGPCACDPAEPQERGVFRAIQKVYASFYNDNAYLERLRRGLKEAELAMGVLVHHSTPDEIELANGVATLSVASTGFGESQLQGVLVTQAGAVSVTNPEGNAKPEVLEATEFGVSLREPSSLVPWGSYVLAHPAEYEALAEMLFRVYREYRGPSGEPLSSTPILDLEYKKVVPGKLLLKQVRALPGPRTNALPRFLLNEPTTYWVYQSESSDVLANHRLKCLLTLQNENTRIDTPSLAQCVYKECRFEFRTGTNLQSLSGAMSSWPGAVHSVTDDPRRGLIVRDGWSFGTGPDRCLFELTSIIPPTANGEGPFVRQAEIRKWLSVTYATPVPALEHLGTATTSTNEEIQIVARPPATSLQPGGAEQFSLGKVSFAVQFLNPVDDFGPPMGVDKNFWGTYPAALSPWMRTRISGLTTEPLELQSYWSQSARAGHKLRYAWYTFEPRLEPGLAARQLEELRAANIELIHIERETWPGGQVTMTVLGTDGQFRRVKE